MDVMIYKYKNKYSGNCSVITFPCMQSSCDIALESAKNENINWCDIMHGWDDQFLFCQTKSFSKSYIIQKFHQITVACRYNDDRTKYTDDEIIKQFLIWQTTIMSGDGEMKHSLRQELNKNNKVDGVILMRLNPITFFWFPTIIFDYNFIPVTD